VTGQGQLSHRLRRDWEGQGKPLWGVGVERECHPCCEVKTEGKVARSRGQGVGRTISRKRD
jgi:hypothetical protein